MAEDVWVESSHDKKGEKWALIGLVTLSIKGAGEANKVIPHITVCSKE